MPPTAARIHALLIGIDAYAKPDSRLAGCVNDVEAFAAFVRAQSEAAAVPCNIEKLTAPLGREPDEKWPTRPRILAALQALASESVLPGERVILYYSGHGTRLYFTKSGTDFEALVPVDYTGSKSQLLFDFELNALLAAIARRSGDLTVILDCCQSGGLTRDLDGQRSFTPRYLAVETDADEEAPAPPDLSTRGLAAEEPTAAVPYCVLAACQANESAVELRISRADGTQQMHGLLSYALLRVLPRLFAQKRQSELRWAEVWEPLRAEMQPLQATQHPRLLGPPWHRVLGGPSEPFDAGLPIRQQADGTLTVGAGLLAGLDADAVLAVYGPQVPAVLPLLDTEPERAARIGTLRVKRADIAQAVVEPVAPAGLGLPPGARARLLQLSPHGRLAVYCTSEVPSADRELLSSLGLLCRLVDTPQEAELLLGQSTAGELLLGDQVFSHLLPPPPGIPGPLAVIPDAGSPSSRAAALTAAIRHYALRYVIALRLCQQSGLLGLRGALKLSAVDCSDADLTARLKAGTGMVRAMPLKDGYCMIQDGARLCFYVHNTSPRDLYVTLLSCNTDGVVDLLGEPVHVESSKGGLIWDCQDNETAPFLITAGQRAISIERLVAIGCKSPDADVAQLARSPYLDEPESLQALIDETMQGRVRALTPTHQPAPEWTLASLNLNLTK